MEYERATTTVVSAYVAGRLREYLRTLEASATTIGITAPLLVMTSSGGVSSVPAVVDAPVRLVESGPAAGATFAAGLARRLRLPSVLSFDMGGTTAKGCFIRDGLLPLSDQIEVARAESFRPGSGFPLRVPTVDLIEVGAGGGSIAARDSVGLIRVGPRSAGAVPGPACYGRGGIEPTVTDADLVLGHLGAESFLGGSMVLSHNLAVEALERCEGVVAGGALQLGRVVDDVITENMASAIMQHLIERGGEPAGTTLVAFGGAGPVHADALARRLGIPRFLVPPLPGVMSAVGLLSARPSFQVTRTVKTPIDRLAPDDLAGPVSEMQAEVRSVLATVDPTAPLRFRTFANCAYVGQSSSLAVRIAEDGRVRSDELATEFAAAYRRAYGVSYDDFPVEVSSLLVSGELPHELVVDEPIRRGEAPGSSGRRPAWSVSRGEMTDFAVSQRRALVPGDTRDGPLIIEERESTTVVDVGGVVTVDEHRNLVVSVA